ncbi:MAG: class I adenylate-forming enzyme family protein [Pseudomonadota bacterium]
MLPQTLSETTPDPLPAPPAQFNMAAHVLHRADALGDKVALAVLSLSGAERWSFARLKAAVQGTGAGFLRAGLTPGDRVLLRLGNRVDYPIAYLGAIAVGLVPIPSSPQLTEREVESVIAITAPKVILRETGIACPETETSQMDLEALQGLRDLPPAPFHFDDPDRPGYIVFTSGTSGKPRAVVHAHRAILARQMMMKDWYDLGENDRLCHAGAFNWTYTMGTGLMDPWTMGATALIPGPEVDIAQLPLLLKRHDATILAAAPGVYRKILGAGVTMDLPKLRHGLCAGEKLSETIRDGWRAAVRTELYEAFGMSECSTFISSAPAHPAQPASLGFAQTGRRVGILGQDGPVPLGEEGTIAVHRSDLGLMLGYLDEDAATAERMQGEWFLTGDQGTMGSDGAITFLGRSDDMMNAGGFRVSPMEVEAVLNTHPAVTQAAVTDIEIKQDARLIMAFYTASAPIDPKDLEEFTTQRLAGYKCPRAFYHLTDLPTGANGKILRRALRPIYETLHGKA